MSVKVNKIELNSVERFKLWESFEIMTKRKNFIITSIDNGVLNTENDLKFFQDTLSRYVDSCKDFINILTTTAKNTKIDNWNISFKEKTFFFEDSDNEIDILLFSLGNLKLTSEYEEILLPLIKQVI